MTGMCPFPSFPTHSIVAIFDPLCCHLLYVDMPDTHLLVLPIAA